MRKILSGPASHIRRLWILSVILLAFVFAVGADAGVLEITVNAGSRPLSGATVEVEQNFDPELIRLGTVTLDKVGSFSCRGSSCQGGAVYGQYFVQAEKGDGNPIKVWFHIFDLEEGKKIASFSMKGDGGAYKNNNANFGTEFYDDSDPFPLLYISSAYDTRTVVIRIYREDDRWQAQQVQVIDYSQDFCNANGFYSCNVLLDNENGFLYLTPINAEYTTPQCTKQWFYKFRMPKLADGEVVTLSRDNALGQRIETRYDFAPQGGCILNGKVYQVFGYGSSSKPGKLGVFDLASGRYETKINLNILGCDSEPESAGYYNGSIYFITVKGGVYRVTPNDYLPADGQAGTRFLANASAVTDAGGKVKFDIVPGASFKVTVSAPGNEPITKTVTAAEYADGLTFTLPAKTNIGAIIAVAAIVLLAAGGGVLLYNKRSR